MEMKVLPSQSEKCCCFSDEEQLTTPGRSRERIISFITNVMVIALLVFSAISPKLVSDTAASAFAPRFRPICIHRDREETGFEEYK
ncbi:unnamed protein product [Cylicocyclus nassatus]|uniref:Uncharacterized protein n=1 Tax=Cylicocyclus nassatus TaxID=53992 RepID=A0AA36ME82_CYLNA|nr:unnamed protein product [Cylicocyclus nassatus]